METSSHWKHGCQLGLEKNPELAAHLKNLITKGYFRKTSDTWCENEGLQVQFFTFYLCSFLTLFDITCSSLAQCSSTCAGGFQRRVVVCQDENGYHANSCEDRSRPSEQRSCESGPCPQWVYGNWGEVGATDCTLLITSHQKLLHSSVYH